MELYILVPLLVCVIGLVVFVASKTNADVKEIGRISFAFGLLVTLLGLIRHAARF